MAWLPIVSAGAGIVSGIANAFKGGGDKWDDKAIQRFFDTANWRGQLYPEDYAAARLAQSRLAGAAATAGQGARMNVARRYEARGLGGSPAEETSFNRTAEDEAMGRERAANAANELLYNVGLGREREQYSKNMAELGAMIGQSNRNQYQSDLKQSTFMNSLLSYGPQLLSGLNQLGGGGGGGGNWTNTGTYEGYTDYAPGDAASGNFINSPGYEGYGNYSSPSNYPGPGGAGGAEENYEGGGTGSGRG
jgi:hypothetical protein